ncbi:ATP-binding protein [Flavobacterium collinsii]|uniref:histidine kinase n=1 Tax=Flavobacterium collinsii TaxID=1114861 RepID=A0ABN7ERJ5_9FLAO|nr:ATP-binding protein [Flavobacterium collinsii]CAA9202469.1 Phytochrome-like protein cph1 [Flavobacterium collinsii]
MSNRNGQDLLEISIKDNGIGLDSANYEKIFTAFERLHSKDQFERNGLGLALCKKIVKRHNGNIKVISELDNGAEFIVSIPLKQLKAAI